MTLTLKRLTMGVVVCIALAAAAVTVPRMSQAASPQVDVYYATANASGQLGNHFPTAGVTVTKFGGTGTGDYFIQFGPNISLTTCAFVASTNQNSPTTASVLFSAGSPNRVEVHTFGGNGLSADLPFEVIATC